MAATHPRQAPVPHTLSADGDPIDVLVCNTRAIVPGAVMNCRPVGVLVVLVMTMRYDKIADYTDLPPISLQQIEHFFAHYKDLEPNKWARIHHWGDPADARRLIAEALQRARSAAKAKPKTRPKTKVEARSAE